MCHGVPSRGVALLAAVGARLKDGDPVLPHDRHLERPEPFLDLTVEVVRARVAGLPSGIEECCKQRVIHRAATDDDRAAAPAEVKSRARPFPHVCSSRRIAERHFCVVMSSMSATHFGMGLIAARSTPMHGLSFGMCCRATCIHEPGAAHRSSTPFDRARNSYFLSSWSSLKAARER